MQQPAGHELASQTHVPVVVLQVCPVAHDPHAAPPVPHWPEVCWACCTHVLPLQQPAGQDAASQTHCPEPLQAWPAAQAAQATPPAPQEPADSLESGSHAPPLQHPEHELPPQLHAPPVHACPPEHVAQAAPPVPHWAFDCEDVGTQVLPAQQPPGQDAASQTHCPLVVLHCCPAPQAAHAAPPAPQEPDVSEAYPRHCPPEVQHPFGQVLASHAHVPLVVSQSPAAHVAHAAPPVPHSAPVCAEAGTHAPALQQPPGQEPALQVQPAAPWLHAWPDAHPLHAAPALPHTALLWEAYGTHVLPLQQPAGHEVASHTHRPLALHSWPVVHAAQAAPPAPHDWEVSWL